MKIEKLNLKMKPDLKMGVEGTKEYDRESKFY
jgi:hypothetical protein